MTLTKCQRKSPPSNIPLAVARQRMRSPARMLYAERVMQVVGVVSILLHRSSRQWESMTDLPLGIATILIMLFFAVGSGLAVLLVRQPSDRS